MMAKFIRAGIGGVAFVATDIVGNLLFFQLGAAIPFDPALQNEMVVDVLFELAPRPLMFENGLLYMAIAAAAGLVHGLDFMLVEPSMGEAATELLDCGRTGRGDRAVMHLVV